VIHSFWQTGASGVLINAPRVKSEAGNDLIPNGNRPDLILNPYQYRSDGLIQLVLVVLCDIDGAVAISAGKLRFLPAFPVDGLVHVVVLQGDAPVVPDVLEALRGQAAAAAVVVEVLRAVHQVLLGKEA
jgi:hypothetical protein